MSIQLISISHKNAPLSVRNLFAFTKDQQVHLMRALVQEGGAAESVVISTCNRTEIYTYTPPGEEGHAFSRMQELILREAEAWREEHITDYLRFYQDGKAIHHLFWVAAGLDSMVVGEDQILGQVKRAQEQAMEAGTAGKYMNTFFRYAITGAKRVKTETELSRTSVSTATLALKAGEERLGSLEGKRVMVMGGTGQIGGIVLKNLYSMKGVHIYSTLRNVSLSHECHAKNKSALVIEYKERYQYLNEMDVIISATASPHYTLTYDKTAQQLRQKKPRVFVDLAVPPDIDGRIGDLPYTWLYNVDDFARLARENNVMKEQAAQEAGGILEEYEQDFGRWLVFQQSAPILEEVKAWMLAEAEKKGFSKAIDKFFYRLREQALPRDLEAFFADIRDMER
ncbi:MAG: glutamyl-tRNA reductase [Lachnospiraceae bacterium]|nr:glutamyl-tRNA reductase [Lachnospiraceae bacterium]